MVSLLLYEVGSQENMAKDQCVWFSDTELADYNLLNRRIYGGWHFHVMRILPMAEPSALYTNENIIINIIFILGS